MSELVQVKIEFTGIEDKPLRFRIITETNDKSSKKVLENISKQENILKDSENQALRDECKALKEKIDFLTKQVEESNTLKDLISKRNQSLQKQNEDLAAQVLAFDHFKSRSHENEQKQVEEVKELRKKLKENEKIISTHFELIEDLKQKYSEDMRQKTSELEKKIIETQKTLNIKSNQVFKFSQLLKEREQKRSSAEIILDEMEKKNNEMIEKNAKSEKTIFDLEKKVNELHKRLQSTSADLKANDEVNIQRDNQMKKLMAKIKSQENEILRLEEENKVKDKRLADVQKTSKNLRSSVEVKGSKNKEDEIKKVWELVAAKDEEIIIMKDMLKSFQYKNPSPANSSSKFIKNSKLPPLATNSSIRELKVEENKPKEIVRVKSNFKIREIDTKIVKKNIFSSPNFPKSVKSIKVIKKDFEDTPSKVSKSKDFYEETPKFGAPGENFPDAKASRFDKLLNEEAHGRTDRDNVFVIQEDENKSQDSIVDNKGKAPVDELEQVEGMRIKVAFDRGFGGKKGESERRMDKDKDKESKSGSEKECEDNENNIKSKHKSTTKIHNNQFKDNPVQSPKDYESSASNPKPSSVSSKPSKKSQAAQSRKSSSSPHIQDSDADPSQPPIKSRQSSPNSSRALSPSSQSDLEVSLSHKSSSKSKKSTQLKPPSPPSPPSQPTDPPSNPALEGNPGA